MKKRILSMLLAIAMVCSLLPTAVFAEEAHTEHCICGAAHASVGDHEEEDEKTFNAISTDGELVTAATTGGNYYLANDIELAGTINVTGNLTLCLNGNTLSPASGFTGRAIEVESGATLVLTDCKDTGAITGFAHYCINNSGIFTLYAGKITYNTSWGVSNNGGTFTMNGGEISHISHNSHNAAENATKTGVMNSGTRGTRGTFTMNGGKITENNGDGVMNNSSYSEFIMNDGEISGNTGDGVYSPSTFTMFGGKITGNTGNGVHTTGVFTMNDGEISGNSGDGIHTSGTVTMNGGKITGNGRGVMYEDGIFNVSGAPVINGNTNGNFCDYQTDYHLTVIAPLTDGAYIGVTLEEKFGEVAGPSLYDDTLPAASNYTKCFHSDKGYEVYDEGDWILIGNKITEQPNAENNYTVETNDDATAKFQWYKIIYGELVPVDDAYFDDNYGWAFGTYGETGWTPVGDSGEWWYFAIKMNAGDTLTAKFASALQGNVMLIYSDYSPAPVENIGENTYVFTAPEYGDYVFIVESDSAPTVEATLVTSRIEEVAGQTAATLNTTGLENGTYACQVTWDYLGTSDDPDDDWTATSDPVEYTVPTYTISVTADPTEGGTTTGSGIYLDGATVTLEATPNTGYTFVNWKNPDDNNSVVSTSSTYTFTAETNCTFVACFELDQNSSGSNEGVNGGTTPQPDYGYSGGYYVPVEQPKDEPKEPSKMDAVTDCHGDASCPISGYTDIDNDAWYHDGVHYCIENGIMGGYGNGIFRPNVAVSRAQISAMLWNMEGNPVVNYALDYTDVPADAWYTEAVRWMISQNIAGGYGKGIYAPDDTLTREQLAAILQKYAQYKGYDMAANKEVDLQSYSDAASISNWAYASMQWICDSGIVGGMPGANGDIILAPAGHVTRAEAATMLYRYCDVIGKDDEN